MPRDLYDVLEVTRDANSDELRLAYRKLALVWHPDKNAARQEEATIRFKEIQNAYEVLSDKNERAWYDSHREEILRGGSTHYAGADTGAPPAEEGINLWAYFSTSAFSGYGDSGLGFYGVYGKVFEEIAKNEMQAARRSGLDFSAPPPLGSFSSPYAAVSAFYSHWLNFSTVKEFLWAAEYNLATAPNRQVRRLMEAENAKKVRAMRKKFNEEVRALAAWCKKRDKRVMERALEQKKLQAVREKEEAKAHKEKLARKKAEQAALYVEQDWAVNEGADKLTDEGWWEDGDGKKDAGDEPQQELYCVACGKSFKSEKQWKNHEKSRKHLERAAALKEALLQEEEEANEASDEGTSDDFDTASEGDDVSEARAGGDDDVNDDVSGGSGGDRGRGPVTDEEILAQLDAQEAEMNRRRSMEDGVRNVRLGEEESEGDGSEVDEVGNKSGESGLDIGANDDSDAGEDDGLGDLLRMHNSQNSGQNGKGTSRTEPAEENESEGRVSEGDEEDGLDDLLRLHTKQKRKEGSGERSDSVEESGSGREEDAGGSDRDDEDGLGDLLRLHGAQNGATQRKKAVELKGEAAGKEVQEEEDGMHGEGVRSKKTEPGATEASVEDGSVREEGKGSDTESVEVGTSETAAEDLKESSDGMEAPQRDTAKVKKARRAANRAKKEGAQTAEVAAEVTSMRGRKGKKGKGGKVGCRKNGGCSM